ncbi:Uncharacterised protein [Vibrio cholerae]|nr:Uncharacterised protein [Vibrio cholerae]CSC80530.1 Uncharacterised protein [Vibrio cholerae]CSI74917.1 Uncharacterised protein [Vibrio cholerae]
MASQRFHIVVSAYDRNVLYPNRLVGRGKYHEHQACCLYHLHQRNLIRSA